jgi:precorrin-6B methylase 2
LSGEQVAPHTVFLGGSGGRLTPILDSCRSRLTPGGRLVANFVTLEHLAACLAAFEHWGWPRQLATVSAARGDSVGGFTGLRPERTVWIVSAEKPS